MRREQNKRKKRTGLTILAAALLLFIGFYIFQGIRYNNHFLPNSKINDLSVGGSTIEEANKKLTQAVQEQQFTLTENGTSWYKVSKKDLGVKTDFVKELTNDLNKQNPWTWLFSYISAPQKNTLKNVTLDETLLQTKSDEVKAKLAELNGTRTATQNATIVKGEDNFTIQKEVAGNSLDVDQILTAFSKGIKSGHNKIELEDYIQKATITSDNTDLIAKQTELNSIIQKKAGYSINGTTFDIPKATIMDWLQFDDEKISLNENAVKQYVTDLGTTYNTSTVPTTFQSTKRGQVSVPAGTYSWTIQTDDETAALSKDILADADFTRSPIVQGSTTADHALIGTTYIEVDLVNQHMWYYKDGALQIETDVVTGKPSTPTPAGVFYIWNKERNATLVGEDYKTPVDHWMPIDWTGVGIHDSPWQTAYGGTRYQQYGSHGCINTPPSVMSQLYDAAAVGVPVVVF